MWVSVGIGGLTFLFFWQYFLLDQTCYSGDTAFVFLPFRHYVTACWQRGELPLWNPCLFGGTPALAESQYQVFYPLNLLLLVTGVPRGMGWMLPLHLALLAAGTYRFARLSLRLQRPAALTATLAFAFGGYVQSRMAGSVYLQAAAWMPWVLLGYDHARRKGGAALVLPGVVLALQFCTGGQQYTYYTLFLLLAYHLYRRREGRAWRALTATLALGGLLSLGQALPELELALQSDRGARASYSFATEFSLAPRHFLVTLLLPKFWGTVNGPTQDGFVPGEELAYLGILPLGLLAAALRRRSGSHTAREMGEPDESLTGRWFWLGVALVALFLAFGQHNPIYPLLYQWVPGLAVFRAPARWLLVSSFATGILAGMGAEQLLRGDRGAARTACVATLALLMVGVWVLGGPWSALASPVRHT
ncbi:MAG: hypothetical protein QHJ73_19435, partial [Armatimonadota bacterium]|nr:hypothetical protein [Armatimonadota bacterium]